MQVEIDGNDLVNAIREQRNEGLDAAASNAASIQALIKKITALEKQLADATKPAGAEKTQDQS